VVRRELDMVQGRDLYLVRFQGRGEAGGLVVADRLETLGDCQFR
jgi:hypothetical protein